jgi:hypothetical protein
MSPRAAHAVLTLVLGLAVGILWLRMFWNRPHGVPAAVLAAPAAVALLGLSHWVAYDFAIGHWAGDFSLMQAVFNLAVAGVLFTRRAKLPDHASAHRPAGSGSLSGSASSPPRRMNSRL